MVRRTTLAYLVALSALAAGCSTGAAGPAGPPGPTGEAGPPGDAGQPWQPVGTIAGTVTAAATGKPLGGASVADTWGSSTTTTASDGTFSMKLALGVHGLTVKRDGYADAQVAVAATASGTTHVAVSMATDPSEDGPTVVVSDDLYAGFGATVTVTAQVTAPDSDPSKLVYAWTQTGGLPAAGLTGTSTTAITFTTLALSDAKLEARGDGVVLGEHDGGLVPARFGAMAFSPDEGGNYSFTFTATDPEGHVTSVPVLVQATPPSSGLRNVPVGIPVWMQGDALGADGGAQTAWSWSLDTTGAPGSKATLSSATAQFPSFVPDVSGTYVLSEGVSGKSASVHAHDWDGISGGDAGVGNDYVAQGCLTGGCHVAPTSIPFTGAAPLAPDTFTPWRATAHATALQRELDGVTPGAGPACVACHALGTSTFPPAASNGGFGEVAREDGWSFPLPEAGAWDDLVAKQPDLAQLGNVQCESCHGPMNVRLMLGVSPETSADGGSDNAAALSFGAGVCGTCHGQASAYPKLEQWKSSPHANLALAMEFGTVDARGTGAAHCGRCHSGQGYSQYAQQLAAGYTGYLTSDGLPAALDGGADGGLAQTNAATVQSLTNLGMTRALVEPQTCAACHDPHGATGNPYQLRLYDVLPGGLPNGQGAITGVGAGAVCMACHNERNGALGALSLASSPSSIPTPHDGPQTDVLFGVNAFFLPTSTPSPHLAVKDTCVGCHYGAPTAAQRAAGETQNHSFVADLTICSTCHGSVDAGSPVDGVALQAQVKAQMAALDRLLFAKIADALGAAATAGGYQVTSALDTATGNPLCTGAGTGAPSFTFTVGPAAASITEPQPPAEWRALTTLWVPYPSLAGTPECTSSGALAATTYGGSAPLSIGLNNVKAGSPAGPVFPPGSIVAQAIWNEALLHDDQTWGVHNQPFFASVIQATTTQLGALP